MNYRCGLQRVYAVLTTAWIIALLFILPADRLKFWQADQWETLADHAVPMSAAAASPQPKSSGQPDIDYDALAKRAISETSQVKFAATPSSWDQSRTHKFLWLMSFLMLPPAVGYAALFLVIPWVYRGFRPRTPK
jgi:hypothetical protein